MRIPDTIVQQMLLDADKIRQEDIERLQRKVEETKKSFQDVIIDDNIIDDIELAQLYAKEIGVNYTRIKPNDIDVKILKNIPERIARKYNVALIDIRKDGTHILAMDDPEDAQAVEFLEKQLGKNIEIYLATRQDIFAVLDQYRESSISESVRTVEKNNGDTDEVAEKNIAKGPPPSQIIDLIIEHAIESRSSTIHIDAHEELVQVRYRIDGVLHDGEKLPKKVHTALFSRIKTLAGIKTNDWRIPQLGRFKANLDNRIFAFRVSILPTVDGEKVVVHISDESSGPSALKELGFWGVGLERINRAIIQPHGMVLVTGPTGAGKSTTLYSILGALNCPDVDISTVEYPVKYRLEGVNQTQINERAGLTFASGLNTILHQDPDIIMLGQMHDSETARLAIQAAHNGHLVLSALHTTNNAATSLSHLYQMGIEPSLIASTVRTVIGQQLIRRMNKARAEKYTPSKTEFKRLESIFGISTKSEWSKIHKLVNRAEKEFGITPSKKPTFWRVKKALKNETEPEYKGRIGIYEVLENSEKVQKQIIASSTGEDVQKQSIKEGMLTMQLDGLIKAMAGMTTIDEVLRVAGK